MEIITEDIFIYLKEKDKHHQKLRYLDAYHLTPYEKTRRQVQNRLKEVLGRKNEQTTQS